MNRTADKCQVVHALGRLAILSMGENYDLYGFSAWHLKGEMST